MTNLRERMTLLDEIRKIRIAVADYMSSEGCGCCGSYEDHKEHEIILGKLLRVKKYSAGSGYDFKKYRTKP